MLNSKNKRKNLLLIFSALSFISFIIWGIWGEKYLYLDGAGYFISIASEGSFILYPPGRKISNMLAQLFAIGAYKAGCSSLQIMGILFGLGLTVWPVFFYSMAIAVCLKYKNTEFAELVYIFASVSMTFVGFYLQVESILGVSVYILELILYLLHTHDKTACSYIETGLMCILFLLTIHLNEYFSFWAWILAAVIIYRIWLAKNKLPLIYFFVAAGQILVALLSKKDISAKGSAPTLSQICYHVLSCKWYILWISLVFIILFFSFEKIKIKSKHLYIYLSEILLFTVSVICFVFLTSTMTKASASLRFTNLIWGIAFGIILLIIDYRNDIFKLQNLTILCCIIAIGFTIFNIKSGIEFKKYNDQYAIFSLEHSNAGFVDEEEAIFQYSDYRGYWTVGFQSISVQGLRGINEISCIVLGDKNTDYYQNRNIYECPPLNRYGIKYNYDAFTSILSP